MNKRVNKFVLKGDQFMSEMRLGQPELTYSACGPFIRYRQKIQKLMQTDDTNYICKNYLGKACFQHGTAYGKYKN